MLDSQAIKIADRIKELSYTLGTGNLALAGAVPGFSSFGSAFSNNTNIFYAITDGISYEVGSGIYLAGNPNQIQRFPIKSTNANNLVNFPEGVKEVYSVYPATNAVYSSSGIQGYVAPKTSGIAYWANSNILNYDSNIIWDDNNNRLGINNASPRHSIDIGGSSPFSSIRSSGVIVGNSGIYFPPANNGDSSYAGGRQTAHYEPNRLDAYAQQNGLLNNLTGSSAILELSGVANNFILLKKQNAGLVFAGPPSGCVPPCSPGYPSFRPLTVEDLPNLSSTYASFASLSSPTGLLNSGISNISGILNNKIDSRYNLAFSYIDSLSKYIDSLSSSASNNSSTINSVSGVLNNKINAVSGLIVNANQSSEINVCQGRLTLQSGVSVSYQNQIDKSILFFVPHNGNSISLYNSNNNIVSVKFGVTQLSLSNTTQNTIYDVFCSLNSSNSITLELGPPWTNDNTRFMPINYDNGMFVQANDKTRRYLGTIRSSNTGMSEDSEQKRFIWNMHNRVEKKFYRIIAPLGLGGTGTSYWTYNGNSWRIVSGDTEFAMPFVELINGYSSDPLSLNGNLLVKCGASASLAEYSIGFATGSTLTPNNATLFSAYGSSNIFKSSVSHHDNFYPTLGYSSYILVERVENPSTSIFEISLSQNGNRYSNIHGKWWC